MKNIAILGSTGSIGTQTLDIVRSNEDLRVVALAAGSNIQALAEQIREFSPKLVCVGEESSIGPLRLFTNDLQYEVCHGIEGLIQVATMEGYDTLVTAIVGMIGILPTMEAIKTGHHIALANKETLVTAGHLIMPLAREHKVQILPVDSEHSAIFQALNGEKHNPIDQILLTASGGPFRGRTLESLANVTLQDALKHPNWAMGRKITIDSSTMVNKGLEVMEARWLFDVTMDQVQVVVQPQSIIHSMVQFMDGSVMAQLGTPDMRLPIQYALFYPERRFLEGKRLDFTTLGSLSFEAPDLVNFPGLALAYKAGKAGGNIPTIYNAANEFAVDMFLQEKIRYLDIAQLIAYAMEEISFIENPQVSQILDTQKATYELLEKKII